MSNTVTLKDAQKLIDLLDKAHSLGEETGLISPTGLMYMNVAIKNVMTNLRKNSQVKAELVD